MRRCAAPAQGAGRVPPCCGRAGHALHLSNPSPAPHSQVGAPACSGAVAAADCVLYPAALVQRPILLCPHSCVCSFALLSEGLTHPPALPGCAGRCWSCWPRPSSCSRPIPHRRPPMCMLRPHPLAAHSRWRCGVQWLLGLETSKTPHLQPPHHASGAGGVRVWSEAALAAEAT